MSYLTIGSGDVANLLMGKQTKGYQNLWRKFLDDRPPYYNALASPIDALRTGAILETNYLNYLPDGYFTQVKSTFDELDVCTSSIDFAKIEEGDIIDFDELKTIFLPDYISIILPLAGLPINEQKKQLKKYFKNNYNQVQFQLLCTGLQEANLVFLSVESYDDEANKKRIIGDTNVTKFRLDRDPEIIEIIYDRVSIFQKVKDHFIQQIK